MQMIFFLDKEINFCEVCNESYPEENIVIFYLMKFEKKKDGAQKT